MLLFVLQNQVEQNFSQLWLLLNWIASMEVFLKIGQKLLLLCLNPSNLFVAFAYLLVDISTILLELRKLVVLVNDA